MGGHLFVLVEDVRPPLGQFDAPPIGVDDLRQNRHVTLRARNSRRNLSARSGPALAIASS